MLPLLDRIRVLDLSRLLPGGVATGKLADLGAEVIKVEEPPLGDYLRSLPPLVDGLGLSYRMLNRNKRSVGIALRTDEGRAVFLDLLATADVVVEGSRPGAMARHGLDFDSLVRVKPDLVYCSITGYGQDGPYADLPSHGMNVDAAAGLLKVEQRPDGPPEIVRASALGIEMGGLHAALAITSALLHRDRTGRPQYIDASCWDGAVAANHAFEMALHRDVSDPAQSSTDRLLATVLADPGRGGGMGPRYNVYGTADGRVLLLCPLERKFWEAFCRAVDRPEWVDRGRWDGEMDFGEDDPALRGEIQDVISTRTAGEWMAVFTAAGVPVSPVLDPEDLVDDPHVTARRMVVRDGEGSGAYVRPPVLLPGHDFEVDREPPLLGADTHAVLEELGYDAARRADLVARGVVAAAGLVQN